MIIERNVLEWRFDSTLFGRRLDIATRYDLRINHYSFKSYTSSLAAASLPGHRAFECELISLAGSRQERTGLPIELEIKAVTRRDLLAASVWTGAHAHVPSSKAMSGIILCSKYGKCPSLSVTRAHVNVYHNLPMQ